MRIIYKPKTAISLVGGQAATYDGLIDVIKPMSDVEVEDALTDDDVKFMAKWESEVVDEVKFNDTIVKPPLAGLKKRHTFAGWREVGEDVPPDVKPIVAEPIVRD